MVIAGLSRREKGLGESPGYRDQPDYLTAGLPDEKGDLTKNGSLVKKLSLPPSKQSSSLVTYMLHPLSYPVPSNR
jgi:hypothetical protein